MTRDVNLPLMVGEIKASVTLIDTETGTDTFDDAFTSPQVIFEIQPAQCDTTLSGRVCPAGFWKLGYGNIHYQSGVYGRDGVPEG